MRTFIALSTLSLCLLLLSTCASRAQQLESHRYDAQGCISFYGQPHPLVIRDTTEFLAAVRRDASRDACLRTLEPIDFTKHSLIGVVLNTGYCRIPLGLEHHVMYDTSAGRYLLDVSYIEPITPCRASSRYGLWLLVPRLPDVYRVDLEVRSLPREG